MTKEELDAIFGHTSNIASGVAQTIGAANDAYNAFMNGDLNSRRNFGPINSPMNQTQQSTVSYGYGYGDYGVQGMGYQIGANNVNNVGYPGISHSSWGMINGGGMLNGIS